MRRVLCTPCAVGEEAEARACVQHPWGSARRDLSYKNLMPSQSLSSWPSGGAFGAPAPTLGTLSR